MGQETYDLHIMAGRDSGEERTCGTKQAYETEGAADYAGLGITADGRAPS